MRKLIFTLFIAATMCSTGLAQEQQQQQSPTNSSQTADEATNMGRAPDRPNGIGRLDLRVVDDSGNPVKGASAKLESTRTDGFFCEAVASTNDRGIAVMPPLHMGRLKLIVKAPGYQKQQLAVLASDLAQPVRVTLARKK